MKKKYIKMTTVGLMLMLTLTGCSNRIPNMTEEQAQQIGEYAAITLLKYDANHRSRLVDISVIEAHDAKEKELQEFLEQMKKNPSQQGMKPVEDTPIVQVGEDVVAEPAINLEDFYGLPKGVAVTYQGHYICDSYSGDASDDLFALDATVGKKLLVLQFNIANQTKSEQSIELFSKEAIYRVTINNSYSRNALTTMLIDDMSTYIGTIAAESAVDVVLLVEIEENLAEDITSITLNLKNESKVGTIQLK